MSITACFHSKKSSLYLTAKKSTKIKFSANKIYYNFSQEYSKIERDPTVTKREKSEAKHGGHGGPELRRFRAL